MTPTHSLYLSLSLTYSRTLLLNHVIAHPPTQPLTHLPSHLLTSPIHPLTDLTTQPLNHLLRLTVIATGCWRLESISLRDCTGITDTGVGKLVKACDRLQVSRRAGGRAGSSAGGS